MGSEMVEFEVGEGEGIKVNEGFEGAGVDGKPWVWHTVIRLAYKLN